MIGRLKMPLHELKQSFNEQLLPRYQQLENREQKILLLAAVFLPLIIMIFGVIIPLQAEQQSLQTELRLIQNKASEAKNLAMYLKKHAKKLNLKSNTQNLLTSVEQLARQSNVRRFITRIKPQSSPNAGQQNLMLRIKNVPYSATLRFIHRLAEHGLSLNSLKLQMTKSPGIINVYAIISKT